MSFISDVFDGVLRKQVFMEGRNLVSRLTQPSQDAILNMNAEMRKSESSFRDVEAMEWALQIPELDYAALIKCNADLTHEHAPTRAAAWKKYIASAESIPYRVRHQKWRSQSTAV